VRYAPEATFDIPSIALLVELARAIGPTRRGVSVDLLWFPLIKTPFALGCGNYFLSTSTDTVIVLEGVGACGLQVRTDSNAPFWMKNRMVELIEMMDYQGQLPAVEHTPSAPFPLFLYSKNVLILSSLDYGTATYDTVQAYAMASTGRDVHCADSLQAVGDVLYHAIPAWEGGLDGP